MATPHVQLSWRKLALGAWNPHLPADPLCLMGCLLFELKYCEVLGGWSSSVFIGEQCVAHLPDIKRTQEEAWAYCAEYVLVQGYFWMTSRLPVLHNLR